MYFTNPNQMQKFSVNAEAIRTHKQAVGRTFRVNFCSFLLGKYLLIL